MSEIFDVNFKDDNLFDHCIVKPKGVEDTNGETWHFPRDWDGDCGQPYPELNEAGYITLADQHMMERDADLLEKTNELIAIIRQRPDGDGPYFYSTPDETAALKRLYEILRTEL